MRAALVMTLLFSACATAPRVAVTRHVARFKSLEVILANAEQTSCTQGLHPIPATVIDVGVFKNVPYQSFSNGLVEFNAYGDPNHLVAIEAGTKDESAKLKGCLVSFIAMQARAPRDREQVLIAMRGRTVTPDGLVIETTEPNEPDAYGAWWLSLEAMSQVSDATASNGEVTAMSSSAVDWAVVGPPPPQYTNEASNNSVEPRAASNQTYVPPRTQPSTSTYRSSSSYRPSGGRVYVHGYTRKDGTYVRSHSRRR